MEQEWKEAAKDENFNGDVLWCKGFERGFNKAWQKVQSLQEELNRQKEIIECQDEQLAKRLDTIEDLSQQLNRLREEVERQAGLLKTVGRVLDVEIAAKEEARQQITSLTLQLETAKGDIEYFKKERDFCKQKWEDADCENVELIQQLQEERQKGGIATQVQIEHLMKFIEEDGTPVDGFRFREVAKSLKAKFSESSPTQNTEGEVENPFYCDREDKKCSNPKGCLNLGFCYEQLPY